MVCRHHESQCLRTFSHQVAEPLKPHEVMMFILCLIILTIQDNYFVYTLLKWSHLLDFRGQILRFLWQYFSSLPLKSWHDITLFKQVEIFSGIFFISLKFRKQEKTVKKTGHVHLWDERIKILNNGFFFVNITSCDQRNILFYKFSPKFCSCLFFYQPLKKQAVSVN